MQKNKFSLQYSVQKKQGCLRKWKASKVQRPLWALCTCSQLIVTLLQLGVSFLLTSEEQLSHSWMEQNIPAAWSLKPHKAAVMTSVCRGWRGEAQSSKWWPHHSLIVAAVQEHMSGWWIEKAGLLWACGGSGITESRANICREQRAESASAGKSFFPHVNNSHSSLYHLVRPLHLVQLLGVAARPPDNKALVTRRLLNSSFYITLSLKVFVSNH